MVWVTINRSGMTIDRGRMIRCWAVMGLANSDHLNISLLFKVDLNSFCDSISVCFDVFVGADLLRNYFDGFCANCASNIVAVININDGFDGQSFIFTNLKKYS